MSTIQFKSIERLHAKKSTFDKSFTHLTTGEMGTCIPILVKEASPGDIWKMEMNLIIRMMPTITPILHPIFAETHTFFVANRHIFPDPDNAGELVASVGEKGANWENFITGNIDGDDNTQLPRSIGLANEGQLMNVFWDYAGLPLPSQQPGINNTLPLQSRPNDLALRAYNRIYNEYIRDQNYMPKRSLLDESIYFACWDKDYFTSALPERQRGTSPALPLEGIGKAIWDTSYDYVRVRAQNDLNANIIVAPIQNIMSGTFQSGPNPLQYGVMQKAAPDSTPWAGSPGLIVDPNQLNSNSIDLSEISTLDMNSLRLAMQTQKYLERNMRSGARYKEMLEARFGETISDSRMQRPEYIGATKTPIIISEVLQTNQVPTPTNPQNVLGAMGGHGISADESEIGVYRCKEHGWIITLLIIRPTAIYHQGIHKQYTRRSRYDYLTPEFVNLSEQPVFKRELVATGNEGENEKILGFQGIYNEMRYSENMVTGKMRPNINGSLSFWHLARQLPTNVEVNKNFLECRPDKNRIFAVPSEPGFIINYGAKNTVVMTLPITPEPGLIDHV